MKPVYLVIFCLLIAHTSWLLCPPVEQNNRLQRLTDLCCSPLFVIFATVVCERVYSSSSTMVSYVRQLPYFTIKNTELHEYRQVHYTSFGTDLETIRQASIKMLSPRPVKTAPIEVLNYIFKDKKNK